MVKLTSLTTALIVSFVTALSLTVPARAEGIDRIKLLADACAVCHGTDGRGSKKIPKLNEGEVKVDDFVETLHGFASGEEKATVMDKIAKGLQEDDYKLLAEYFYGLK